MTDKVCYRFLSPHEDRGRERKGTRGRRERGSGIWRRMGEGWEEERTMMMMRGEEWGCVDEMIE